MTTQITFTPTPVDRFSKDHWSMFAYVETCCVDASATKGVGMLDRRRVRTNEHRHPMLASNFLGARWKQEYATRLQGYFEFPERNNAAAAIEAGFMIDGHDDWDCLEDLEAAGLVEIISLANCAVKMTERGMEVAGLLRAHKARGNHFATFVWFEPKTAAAA